MFIGFGHGAPWNLKHPFINGWFNWMIPNLYIGNGLFYETSIKNWLALEFQADCKICLAYLRAFRGPHNGWNNPSVTTKKKTVAAGSAWKCQTCTGIHSHQRNRLETYTWYFMMFCDTTMTNHHQLWLTSPFLMVHSCFEHALDTYDMYWLYRRSQWQVRTSHNSSIRDFSTDPPTPSDVPFPFDSKKFGNGSRYGSSGGPTCFRVGSLEFPLEIHVCRLPSNLSSGARSAVAHIRLQGLPLAIGKSEGVDLWGPEKPGGTVIHCKIGVPPKAARKIRWIFCFRFFAIK